MKTELFNKFYLDKEKDIIVNLYRRKEDELEYILETPNHNTGNLISNLAKICKTNTIKNEKNMKIIKGTIPANINGDNEIVYIFRLAGIKIANIYENGKIEIKGKIPAISKTLMSQTKQYNMPVEKTIVKSYILKRSKFRTDLHTHMNANLTPDILIALGIARQIRYPLYYIKKLGLKITKKQEKTLLKQRAVIENKYINSELKGKYLKRKIDDNTFINFADFILNNLENAEYNISKIRNSLAILKDGQAVFTNLEKVYLYRYVFAKGIETKSKIKLDNIDKIPEKDIKKYVNQILTDHKKDSKYEKNTLREDKLLWVAREYKRQGIKYVEITDTELVKIGEPAINYLEEIHRIIPKIEEDTGVQIRFLAGIRRIPLTIIKDVKTSNLYLRENLDTIKAVAKSPYVVGSDFIGEEINDITELKPVIKELVEYAVKEDNGFTIRIHAGENDSLRDNVSKSIEAVIDSTPKGFKIPKIRIGHGLYTPDINSEKGKQLLKNIKKANAILEFQLTSNVRLNNLNTLANHPLKEYLKNGVKCVQGTDGCGLYGSDTIDEQLALHNLLGLNDDDFKKMRIVENEIIEDSNKYFKEKQKKFNKLINNKLIKKAILKIEEENIKNSLSETKPLRLTENLQSEQVLKEKIKQLPTNKVPIIIAGGSFNSNDRKTRLTPEGMKLLKELIQKIDTEKAYFVIGHKMEGYEKEIVELSNRADKKFEIDAIIPKTVSETVKSNLLEEPVDGVCISTESEGLGIYKSFNYEIFERRSSVVLALDGNSPVSNLVQEAKNGKGNAKIYVNEEIPVLKEKALSLGGYVIPFNMKQSIVEKIIEDNPEII
ncbi:MAG: adenosine deaminase [Clostridia bacterium]|nr:adenosine deaminase [Clostridia bacterium]